MPRIHKCKSRGCDNTVDRSYSSTKQVCSVPCAIAWGREKEAKKRNKAHQKDKKELRDNDRSFQLKKAQTLFNSFIRLRDKREGCISCTNPFGDKYDAGHYRSTGAHPELRFNEYNNNGQCVHCNQHLSGNLVDYRIQLIKKIGVGKVEWIEGSHDRPKLTIDDIKAIQDKYKAKIKEIEND